MKANLTHKERLVAAALKATMPDDPHCTVAGSAARHAVHAACCKAVGTALAVDRPAMDWNAFMRACGSP